jgi:phosphatidylserine decarboxylase
MYIFYSSLILSSITLIPLGLKWEIEKKILLLFAPVIGIIAGAIVFTICTFFQFKPYQVIILELVTIAGISISLLIWRFFRNPERIPPEPDNYILSPADGRIIYIKRIRKGEIPISEKNGRKFFLNDFTKTEINFENGYIIGIGMNFLDVHVNRAPIGGKIILLKRIKGLFISLKKKEAVLQNERLLTVISTGHYKTGIVQIASRLVRKIVSYLKDGQEVKRGDRIGLIRFGSQVDLILPDLPAMHIKVILNDKVKACTSILASFDNTFSDSLMQK